MGEVYEAKVEENFDDSLDLLKREISDKGKNKEEAEKQNTKLVESGIAQRVIDYALSTGIKELKAEKCTFSVEKMQYQGREVAAVKIVSDKITRSGNAMTLIAGNFFKRSIEFYDSFATRKKVYEEEFGKKLVSGDALTEEQQKVIADLLGTEVYKGEEYDQEFVSQILLDLINDDKTLSKENMRIAEDASNKIYYQYLEPGEGIAGKKMLQSDIEIMLKNLPLELRYKLTQKVWPAIYKDKVEQHNDPEVMMYRKGIYQKWQNTINALGVTTKEVWEYKTGLDRSKAQEKGFTDGSKEKNLELYQKLDNPKFIEEVKQSK